MLTKKAFDVIVFTSVSSPLGNIFKSCSRLQAKHAALYLKMNVTTNEKRVTSDSQTDSPGTISYIHAINVFLIISSVNQIPMSQPHSHKALILFIFRQKTISQK